jgi:RecG-like helicase
MSSLTKLRLRKLFEMRSRTNADAQDLQATTESVGATPIRECDRGEKVTACGVLKSVVIRPRAGAPALEAELYDGSGSLTLVWLGRRRITGIEVGKSIIVEGKMTCDGDQFTLFNPRYQLRPLGVT